MSGLNKHEMDDEILSKALPNHLKRIKKFQNYKKLKKIILTYFCTRLQDSKLMNEAEMFEFIDKNNDGVLSIEELKACMTRNPEMLSQKFKEVLYENVPVNDSCSKDITAVFDAIDTDKNGVIDYTEWLAAAKDWSGVMDSTMIKDAFNAFDLNSDGEIGWEELKEIMKENVQSEDQDAENGMSKMWKDIVAEVDGDGDGKIKIDDFMKLFESKLTINQ